MPYAIEMFFDPAADARIRGLWEKSAAFEASFMRDSGTRPHISLLVCDSLDVPAACQMLEHFAGKVAGLPFTLASFGAFPSASPVVFLAPKVTPELLQLHADFFSEFGSLGRDCWPHYSPLQWVPHCTIAIDFDAQRLSDICRICLAADLPISGTITEIGLVEFRPVRHLHSVLFTGITSQHGDKGN